MDTSRFVDIFRISGGWARNMSNCSVIDMQHKILYDNNKFLTTCCYFFLDSSDIYD